MTNEKLAELLAQDRVDVRQWWKAWAILLAIAIAYSLLTRGTWKLEPKDGDDFAISAGALVFYQYVVNPILERLEGIIALLRQNSEG